MPEAAQVCNPIGQEHCDFKFYRAIRLSQSQFAGTSLLASAIIL